MEEKMGGNNVVSLTQSARADVPNGRGKLRDSAPDN